MFKKHWQTLKRFVATYWYSLLLAVGSIWYGYQLFSYPVILNTYKVYQNISDMVDSHAVGVFFMVLGIITLASNVFHLKQVKRHVLVVHTFVWTFFGASFVLTEPPNTVGVLALVMAGIAIGVSLRGDYRGK